MINLSLPEQREGNGETFAAVLWLHNLHVTGEESDRNPLAAPLP